MYNKSSWNAYPRVCLRLAFPDRHTLVYSRIWAKLVNRFRLKTPTDDVAAALGRSHRGMSRTQNIVVVNGSFVFEHRSSFIAAPSTINGEVATH